MGTFKPMLPMGDSTVLSHVIDNLQAAGVEDINVVTGHHAQTLAPLLDRPKVRRIHNPDYESGMLSSVIAGLQGLPDSADACLILPVDIPLVRPATLRRLCRSLISTQTMVVYPTFCGQRGHPPLIRRPLFGDIIAQSRNAPDGLKGILLRYEAFAQALPVFDEAILLDMDTPDDYRRLSALADSREVPSEEECEAIMTRFSVSKDTARHSRRVAQVAQRLAQALESHGYSVDMPVVRAGALLHDIVRTRPHHAAAGATVMQAIGFPRVAPIVASHMNLEFSGGMPDAAAIVYLADKLVLGDQVVSLYERFQPAFERFRNRPAAQQGARNRYDSACAIAGSIIALTGTPLNTLLGNIGP
jgi:putative nucleotidyltransferase with HDIG domain